MPAEYKNYEGMYRFQSNPNKNRNFDMGKFTNPTSGGQNYSTYITFRVMSDNPKAEAEWMNKGLKPMNILGDTIARESQHDIRKRKGSSGLSGEKLSNTTSLRPKRPVIRNCLKAQGGVSEPDPANPTFSTKTEPLTQGGGAPSDALRSEPFAFEELGGLPVKGHMGLFQSFPTATSSSNIDIIGTIPEKVKANHTKGIRYPPANTCNHL